ncbi:MAG: class I SAM-dependent methyltransferase [Halorhodospira sp.]
MFKRTNPDIDYDALERRVAEILDSAKASGPEGLPDWPSRTPPSEAPRSWTRRAAHRMQRWPLLGRGVRWLIDKTRPVRQAGPWGVLKGRARGGVARLRRRPVVGPLVAWGVGLVRLGHTRTLLGELQAQQERLEQDLQDHARRLADQQAALTGHDQRIEGLQADLGPIAEAAEARRREIQQLRERVTLQAAGEATSPATGVEGASSSHAPGEAEPEMAAFYEALEDHFRGSETAVEASFHAYRQWVEDCAPIQAGMGLLDLGCGRGEWLAVLAAAGLPVEGVETNPAALERCRARGLPVQEADLLAALQARAPESLGAITAFHVAEHLPFPRLLTVLQESLRVLAPGGRLVLETPNPENLNVGAHTFHLDPTHARPLPPSLLEFAAAYLGFAHVAVERLHPVPEAYRAPEEGAVATHVNARLYGPQDYALIATKGEEGQAQ